jgi:hypothetical protein
MLVDEVDLGAIAGRQRDGLAVFGDGGRESTSFGVLEVQPLAQLD